MKYLMMITMLSMAILVPSCTQSKAVAPDVVVAAFNAKFPDVSKAEWEMENENEWEAEFKMNGQEYSATFTKDGNWIETEQEISLSEIPADMRSVLDENFSDYKIEEAELGDSPNGSFYEFEIETGDEELEVMIDANGKLTREKESRDKDDDD